MYGVTTNSNVIKKRIRVDKILVEKYPHLGRSMIQDFIKRGLVTNGGKIIKRPAQLFFSDEISSIEIGPNSNNFFYVSRAANKLRAAVEYWKISIAEKVCADVGAGSGGFSQYLLEQGASLVYAVDVGHKQLSPILRDHSRLVNYEGINAKYPFSLPQKIDVLVADLSFISIRKVLKNLFSLLSSSAVMIILFKPQFEVGEESLSNRGLVIDRAKGQQALADFFVWYEQQEWLVGEQSLRPHLRPQMRPIAVIPSPLRGKEGNQEYLLFFDMCDCL
ncbi:MAG: TlyA family RNA methyltransferase [Oligoflexia bacterium]|nr:TlyA family RNA methyltransferase [Oligoflexia bacterium]